MFVNQLSPGDKLSLKGKIFELQKKLNILDVEQQHTEDYSFRPEITQYKLPNRQNDFINNLNQAEETRKGRFEALKTQLAMERTEDCSFSPQINVRKKDQIQKKKDQKPVHLRLTEKGKEYQESAEKRKEMVKSHDFDGKELFKPRSSGKTHVAKGNMQVEEYLYRDAKDRVEKMDIKRENEKKDLERVASKQKMNKHSAILVKRKSERESRHLFDFIYSSNSVKNNHEAEDIEKNKNQCISLSQLQFVTVSMLKFFEKNKKTISFHNGITNSSSPYEVAEKVWNLIDLDETNEVNLRVFLSACIPVLVSGGKMELYSTASKNDDSTQTKQMTGANISYLYQYLSALNHYIHHKKRQEKENNSSIAKKHKSKFSDVTGKDKSGATSVMSSIKSEDLNIDTECMDDESVDQSQVSDDTSISASTKSYNEKVALSRRIQSYNKVLTNREVVSNKKLDILRETLIEKELEECTFQPCISNTARKLRERELNKSLRSGSGEVSKAHDRLYAKKDVVPRSIAQGKHIPTADRGLEECTFTPEVNHTNFAAFNHDIDDSSAEHDPKTRRQSRMEKSMQHFFGDLEVQSRGEKDFTNSPDGKTKKGAGTVVPRGYAESINRIRAAADNKKKKEAEEEAFFGVSEERYNKGLQQMAEGPKPFRFRTDERHEEKEKMYAKVMDAQGNAIKDKTSDDADSVNLKNSKADLASIRGKTKLINGELKPIRLYVDIKLGSAKNSHIAVADLDVPALLARDFCKIYGLDPSAESVLAQVVENNMISNDIPIGSLSGDNNITPRGGGGLMSDMSRRSFADSTTYSGHNLDYDDDDYGFFEHPSPQENSMPLYDHPF